MIIEDLENDFIIDSSDAIEVGITSGGQTTVDLTLGPQSSSTQVGTTLDTGEAATTTAKVSAEVGDEPLTLYVHTSCVKKGSSSVEKDGKMKTEEGADLETLQCNKGTSIEITRVLKSPEHGLGIKIKKKIKTIPKCLNNCVVQHKQ